jgi:hypothetical protein
MSDDTNYYYMYIAPEVGLTDSEDGGSRSSQKAQKNKASSILMHSISGADQSVLISQMLG